MKKSKLAILDLYDGETNQGMRAIKNIVNSYQEHFDWKVFDVRGKGELPTTDYDVYISSGGPGSPLDGDGVWNKKFFDLIDELWEINRSKKETKKYVFFICHSFQMACDHFDLARVLPRKSRSFGTTPVHKTQAGKQERFFAQLPEVFCAADFRHWQVIQPDYDMFLKMGAKIMALEKIREHIPLERAIMAVRFSEEMFGVQFHPEADPEGMLMHFNKTKNKAGIVEEHGQKKFDQMMEDLNDPQAIPLTYDTILPNFLDEAVRSLELVAV